jgi:Thymidylate kinase
MIELYIYYSVLIDGKLGNLKSERVNHSEAIKRDLLAGTTIIVDRYVYSGVAFSTAKVVCLVLS